MLDLYRVVAPAVSAVALAECAEHLRFPANFGPEVDAEAEAELRPYVAAATAALERRYGLALIDQRWVWRLWAWPRRLRGGILLPLSPVTAIDSVTIYDSVGNAEIWAADEWALDPAADRFVALNACWPRIDEGGRVEIVFDAGFGATPDAVPADIRLAVKLLTAHYYEHRAESEAGVKPLPMGVEHLMGGCAQPRLSLAL